MPNPKRKWSKSRRDKHRTHYKLTPPQFGKCPNCTELKVPHAVCPSCGYNTGRVMIRTNETA
jgi:large subunit ribosomal protein L32